MLKRLLFSCERVGSGMMVSQLEAILRVSTRLASVRISQSDWREVRDLKDSVSSLGHVARVVNVPAPGPITNRPCSRFKACNMSLRSVKDISSKTVRADTVEGTNKDETDEIVIDLTAGAFCCRN